MCFGTHCHTFNLKTLQANAGQTRIGSLFYARSLLYAWPAAWLTFSPKAHWADGQSSNWPLVRVQIRLSLRESFKRKFSEIASVWYWTVNNGQTSHIENQWDSYAGDSAPGLLCSPPSEYLRIKRCSCVSRYTYLHLYITYLYQDEKWIGRNDLAAEDCRNIKTTENYQQWHKTIIIRTPNNSARQSCSMRRTPMVWFGQIERM